MNKLYVFLLLIFAGVILEGCKSLIKEKEQPNILWIVADDLGTDLSCYNTPLVKTPNIDNLAGQGIKFNNCFTVTAVCSPSRSALVTGMYPVSINCHQHRTRKNVKKFLPNEVKVITEYFEEAGYFTFNGRVGNKDKPGKKDYNFITDYPIYDGTDWSQREKGQPFFGQIQIHFPHRPFAMDPDNPIDEQKVILPPYLPDHWVARKDWALYLETIQIVDRQVGNILKRLKDEGFEDNTYVFFFGDQGRPMVRHKQFLYDGGINTPLIIRYPDKQFAGDVRDELISNIDIAPTSLKLAGIKLPEHLQGQNFLNDHKKREFVFSMRDRRDETVDRIRSVRSNKYKYIMNYYPQKPYIQYNAYKRNYYPTLILMEVMKKNGELNDIQMHFFNDEKPEEELYDIENDPFEINNLAFNKEYVKVKKQLNEKLNLWIDKNDKGEYPEDKLEIDYWNKEMSRTDSLWKSKKGFSKEVSDEDYLIWWEELLKKRR